MHVMLAAVTCHELDHYQHAPVLPVQQQASSACCVLLCRFGAGFAFGAWNGLLAAQGIPMTSVPCRRWKSDLQLTAKGKAGSRQLALDLFPHAQPLLK